MIIRKALIGELVELPSGERGKVTGINDKGIARVVIENGRYEDIDQNALRHIVTQPLSRAE